MASWTSHGGRRQGVRIMNAIDVVGAVLTLQLCFLLTAWPVITAVPAFVAVQSQLVGALAGGEARAVRGYLTAFRRALRVAWFPGLVTPVLGATVWLSVSFWLAADTTIATVAVGVLCVLLGSAAAALLAALAASGQHPDEPWRSWFVGAWGAVTRAPLAAAGAVFALLTWALALVILPTLALAGAGVVPGLLAHWAFGPRRPRHSSRPGNRAGAPGVA